MSLNNDYDKEYDHLILPQIVVLEQHRGRYTYVTYNHKCAGVDEAPTRITSEGSDSVWYLHTPTDDRGGDESVEIIFCPYCGMKLPSAGEH